ncbi:cysteine--tRNA ligase [Streptomyces sp. H10-C2]|uniref:cysteine--tRNA ligase n=1 Tax=unclassified Streptomyces TaxID=2593676 RepID=UPI0024B99D43|nr:MULTISPECIES: cysteine--tRNA ligase [unclassified Streptomyces]MDJ0346294.1 cysteine--tRNA ligase [Streptomyces sp. PH10-H1]MDJ0374903.1 cysteine--tRNA ligase [Streptomyces sp. H10-C2]
MPLYLHNTLTRRKEEFVPRTPGVVQMFVCGPTVYSLSHVGHAKTYTQFDLIARYLKKRGYRVIYAQNLTDVDDKIIAKASEAGVDPRDLATRYEADYLDDMAALHNTNVDVYGRAHDHIPQIVAQIQQLIERGHAYQLEDGWYYDLSTFPDYGKLSGRTETRPEDSVARIDENQYKRNPGDFALWKARKADEPYWDTALGAGRPGWHIEDTAITEALFGPQYDLHGGAVDLIFPHHEAEVAQMEAASGRAPLVRYWMHTGLLRINGEKMSKSTGNFLTIRDALKTADYRTLRYVFLSHHYRSAMELTDTVIAQSSAARRRVENFARLIDPAQPESQQSISLISRSRERIFERLDDDLDTPGALAALFDFIREQNRSGEVPGPSSRALLQDVDDLFDAFDIEDHSGNDVAIEAELAERRALRSAHKFEEADAIRKSLQGRGIVLEDTTDTTRWWYEER